MLGAFLIHPCTPDQIELVKQHYRLKTLPTLYGKSGYPPVFPTDLKPIIGGKFFDSSGKLVMIFPVIPLSPVQFLQRRANNAVEAVKEAIELGLKEGATVFGLGALSAPVTDGGRMLVNWDGLDSALLTTGNSYTAYAAFEGVKRQATLLEKNLSSPNFKVSIIGATGSVGQGLTSLLIQAGVIPNNITGIGRSESKIKKLEAAGIIAGTMDLESQLNQSDVVVFCTSGYPFLSANAVLGAGAILDMTMPSFIESKPELKKSILENGILLEHGGVIGWNDNYRYEGMPLGLEPLETRGWACEIDTAIRALDGEKGRHAIGPVDSAEAKRMAERAKHYGFKIIA